MAWQKACGVAVGTVFCQERHTGRALKLCQLDLGTMVSTQEKTMATPSSAPTLTGAASQTGLRWEHAATQMSGCVPLSHQDGTAAVGAPVGGAPR